MSLVKPGDVIVDVGANVGYFSVLAAWRAQGPGGQIWAFEPNPTNYRLMADNLNNNGFLGMAHRHQLALSDKKGEAQLRLFPGYEATSTIRELSEEFISATEAQTGRESSLITAPMDTLDNVMRDCPAVDFMKIDAEGHEPQIIDGALELLSRSPNIKMLMECVPPIMDPEKTRAMLDKLQALSFRMFRIGQQAELTEMSDTESVMAIDFSDLLLVKR